MVSRKRTASGIYVGVLCRMDVHCYTSRLDCICCCSFLLCFSYHTYPFTVLLTMLFSSFTFRLCHACRRFSTSPWMKHTVWTRSTKARGFAVDGSAMHRGSFYACSRRACAATSPIGYLGASAFNRRFFRQQRELLEAPCTVPWVPHGGDSAQLFPWSNMLLPSRPLSDGAIEPNGYGPRITVAHQHLSTIPTHDMDSELALSRRF